MTYVEGFVVAVPTANKEDYRKHAADAAPMFKEFGVTRMVENWGDDVPEGKVTDFHGAVQAKDDETVVFTWFEYPDKATRDAANEKMMTDPRMEEMGAEHAVRRQAHDLSAASTRSSTRRPTGTTGYTDGYRPARARRPRRTPIATMAQKMAGKFKDYGALRVVEAWGDDVPDGKVTDYQARGEGRGRRERRLFLRRMARQGDPRRRPGRR